MLTSRLHTPTHSRTEILYTQEILNKEKWQKHRFIEWSPIKHKFIDCNHLCARNFKFLIIFEIIPTLFILIYNIRRNDFFYQEQIETINKEYWFSNKPQPHFIVKCLSPLERSCLYSTERSTFWITK